MTSGHFSNCVAGKPIWAADLHLLCVKEILLPLQVVRSVSSMLVRDRHRACFHVCAPICVFRNIWPRPQELLLYFIFVSCIYHLLSRHLVTEPEVIYNHLLLKSRLPDLWITSWQYYGHAVSCPKQFIQFMENLEVIKSVFEAQGCNFSIVWILVTSYQILGQSVFLFRHLLIQQRLSSICPVTSSYSASVSLCRVAQ